MMKGKLMGAIGFIVGMAALVGVHRQGGAFEIAPAPIPANPATLITDNPGPPGAPPVQTGYSRYTRSGQYSIEFPDGAYLKDLGNDYLIITNYSPRSGGCCFQPGDLKTDISIQSMPFETALQNAILTPDEIGDGSQQVRQVTLTIDGRDALRTWATGGDNGADSVSTIVRLSATETVFITSFSATGDDSMQGPIETIHNSFQALN
ncbi:MAG: PsbP-related protein [Cyanobacteria bacterium P01_F01_bin.4]